MSEIEKPTGSDLNAAQAPASAVTSEAVITAPEQQAALTARPDTGSYELKPVDFVEAQQKAPESQEGPRFVPPFYDLRFDYTVDPLQEGVGKLSLNIDSITDKMSALLNKPEIKQQDAFSMQSLRDTIEHPDLTRNFSPEEIQSLRLMANQARRLIDPARVPEFDPETIREGKLPMDQLYISKESVLNAGRKLGVIRDA